MNASRTRLPAFALSILAATLLSGCGVSTTLHVSDSSSSIGSVRVVKRLSMGPGGPGIEAEGSALKASATQVLNSSDIASFGSQSIAGPATLQNSARVEHAQLVYNHLLFAGRPVELEWFVGAIQVRTRWDTTSSRSTDPRLTSQTTWSGPVGGVLGRIHVATMLSVEGRYSGAVAVGGRINSGQRTFTELSLAFRPVPVVVLRGGLAESRTFVRPELFSTELSVRARGPFLNLGLEF